MAFKIVFPGKRSFLNEKTAKNFKIKYFIFEMFEFSLSHGKVLKKVMFSWKTGIRNKLT